MERAKGTNRACCTCCTLNHRETLSTMDHLFLAAALLDARRSRVYRTMRIAYAQQSGGIKFAIVLKNKEFFLNPSSSSMTSSEMSFPSSMLQSYARTIYIAEERK